MAEIKDFGLVKSWYEAYKQTQLNEKKVEDENVKVLPKDEDEEKEKKPEPKAVDDADSLKAENEKLKAEIEKLKLDVKKKDSETNVEPNADTGEVPLRVGIAQSILDKKKKDKKEVKEMAKDDAYAIGMSVAKKKMKDEPPLEKKTIKKGHEIAKKIMKKEDLDEGKVADAFKRSLRLDYAKKLSNYAAKRGGIDKKDFMKISKQMTTAKSDMDLKKIAGKIDDMDTEPRDLLKGSIALQLGPKTYQAMFGDRLTSSDMNQYKRMTPKDMREETLDEVNVNAKGTITSKQMNSLKKSYNSLPDRIDPEKAMALSKMLDRFGEGELRQLTHTGIKFISTLAINKLIMKHKYKAKDIHDIRKNKPKTVFD